MPIILRNLLLGLLLDHGVSSKPGGKPSMYEHAVRTVARNLRGLSRIVGVGREGIWKIGPEVVREAIVNARGAT
jgi:hypothetical protein